MRIVTRRINNPWSSGSPTFDGLDMTAKAAKYFSSLCSGEVVIDVVESEMHDVVVMNLFGRELIAHIEPDAVEEIDFFWRQVRRVRTNVEDAFLASRKVDAE